MSEKKLIITVQPVYTHEAGPGELKALNMPNIENHLGDILPYVDEILAKAGYPPGSKAKISITEDGKELVSKETEIL